MANGTLAASQLEMLSQSGTGITTIVPPATNTDRTLTLPDTTAPILAGSGITLSASAPANTLVTTDAGNVGIGTSSPADKLHTVGNGRFSGAELDQAVFVTTSSTNTSAGAKVFLQTGNRAYALQVLNNAFRVVDDTAGLERMRLTSEGRVGIGTASPAQKLDVSGNVRATQFFGTNGTTQLINTFAGDNRPLFIQNSNAGGLPNGSLFIQNTNNPNNSTFKFINCVASNAIKFIVSGNGSVENSTGVYGAISDSRIKKDIVDTAPKLDKLLQVRVVNYTRTDDPTESRQLGVIAQELEEVFPGLVDVVAEKGVDGNVTCPDRKSVKYSIFVPMLIKAIQEQQAIIAQLQADVETLKAQNPVQPDPNAG